MTSEQDLPAVAGLMVPWSPRSRRARPVRGNQARLPHGTPVGRNGQPPADRRCFSAPHRAGGAPWGPPPVGRAAAAVVVIAAALRAGHMGHRVLHAALPDRAAHVGDTQCKSPPADPYTGERRPTVARLSGAATP